MKFVDPRLAEPREVDVLEIAIEVTLRDDAARRLIDLSKRAGKPPVEAFADLVERILGKRVEAGAIIEIPAWVPDWLYEDYLALAKSEGEEVAARYARARKRERPA